jgi:hypothetical protein
VADDALAVVHVEAAAAFDASASDDAMDTPPPGDGAAEGGAR